MTINQVKRCAKKAVDLFRLRRYVGVPQPMANATDVFDTLPMGQHPVQPGRFMSEARKLGHTDQETQTSTRRNAVALGPAHPTVNGQQHVPQTKTSSPLGVYRPL
ncbi:hypothetical protein M407DRAFT_241881 [Tulasnella calospora MUT 4182]|uniref:Uncharacterized protein n=1 Tax=Tulasnella calospora MUT 4182 TaxID=1051891 RepID=A0A0C3QR70_9AGAM|nr:hypothetical protein M407DRAFT_241881 [Tulasnella calospora MUT 4182]